MDSMLVASLKVKNTTWMIRQSCDISHDMSGWASIDLSWFKDGLDLHSMQRVLLVELR